MDVRRPERLFPVFRAALAGVAQRLRPRGHPLLELRREAVERILRHAQRLEALEAERDAHPGIAGRAGRVGGRGHHVLSRRISSRPALRSSMRSNT